ncbi:MBL fold metallo-hydrolase [Sporosarcina sp. PTS2304]|uniref:MBL fold metallo-hydrolase n=1 Tax=Sporosarcina sp. PTS2304 TaxID=2283194 RepID=UPI000E0DC3D9|nr:MBL fold metallo-hydrolase [Sporosarcina sp. PTS2304]AXH99331.1 MBL fold metallo-hydrolase [Sporosarcina sp. PTS2304]
MKVKHRYTNLDSVDTHKTMKDMLQWQQERKQKKKDLSILIKEAPTKEIEQLHANRSATSITWIGHSTFLIQMNGLNMITDPVWAKRMGFQKRLTEPGIPLAKLPPIDYVFISHGHYDHLDFATIKRLPGDPTFFVPIGLGRSFKWRGYKKVIESEWYDSFIVDELTFTFVPAQHWTKRTLTDTNTSHWGGWILESPNDSIYFVGDTGYFRGFKEISEKFSIQTVLMPIGAYEPEWFMQESHLTPEEAIQAFIELKGSTLIPMHYGTYHLADDTGSEAIDRLDAEWNRRSLAESVKKKLMIGETLWV